MIEQQSRETDEQRRRQQVWALERKRAEDAGRPIIFYASNTSCWRPTVKGLTLMVNSVFNGLVTLLNEEREKAACRRGCLS